MMKNHQQDTPKKPLKVTEVQYWDRELKQYRKMLKITRNYYTKEELMEKRRKENAKK